MSNTHEPLPIDSPSQEMFQHPLAQVMSFLRAVHRRKGVMLLCLIASLALGATYYTTAERMYKADAEIMVLDTGGNSFDDNSGSRDALRDNLPTYKRLLQSDEVLKKALAKMPAKHREPLLGGSKQQVIDRLRDGLSVINARGEYILSVSYVSNDPEACASIVNHILDAYVEFMKETQQDGASVDLEVLTKKGTEIDKDLSQKYQDLLLLRTRFSELLGTGDNSVNIVEQRAKELNSSLVSAQKEAINAKTFLNAVQMAIQNGESLQQLAAQASEVVGNELMKIQMGVDTRDSYNTGMIQRRLIDSETELERLLQNNFGERHPDVLRVREEIRRNRTFLDDRFANAADVSTRLNSELGPQLLQIATQKYQQSLQHQQQLQVEMDLLQSQAVSMTAKQVELDILKDEIDRLKADKEGVIESMKSIDLGQQNALKIKITKFPEPPQLPVSPKLSLTIVMSTFLGLCIGFGVVYLIDTLDDRFRSPDDLKQQVGFPILAMIRQMSPVAEEGIEAVHTYAKPNGVETESFRTLRSIIDFNENGYQKVSISSTEPSDGKTTVMSNLSVAFAQAGKRTIAIDGDMRRPGLTKLFGLKGPQGLSSVLRDVRPVGESFLKNVCKTKLGKLDILPAGPKPVNPVELLTSPRFSELLSYLESEYDQILIDAPPSLAVADPAIIGRLVDAAILTVRPDSNKRKMVIRAAEALTCLGCNLIGLVVNRVTSDSEGYGYGYGYGYGTAYEDDDHEHDDHHHSGSQFDYQSHATHTPHQPEPVVETIKPVAASVATKPLPVSQSPFQALNQLKPVDHDKPAFSIHRNMEQQSSGLLSRDSDHSDGEQDDNRSAA